MMPARWLALAGALVLSLPAGKASAGDRPAACRSSCVPCMPDIQSQLNAPVSFDFKETTLKNVLDDLGCVTGLNVMVDWAALEEEGVCLDQPVSLNLEGVNLKSALNLLLHQVHLAWAIEDESLRISTEKCVHACKKGCPQATSCQSAGTCTVSDAPCYAPCPCCPAGVCCPQASMTGPAGCSAGTCIGAAMGALVGAKSGGAAGPDFCGFAPEVMPCACPLPMFCCPPPPLAMSCCSITDFLVQRFFEALYPCPAPPTPTFAPCVCAPAPAPASAGPWTLRKGPEGVEIVGPGIEGSCERVTVEGCDGSISLEGQVHLHGEGFRMETDKVTLWLTSGGIQITTPCRPAVR
jgi:hypothetical protein